MPASTDHIHQSIADKLMRHTIVARSSNSNCGNCNESVLPEKHRQCPECRTVFCFVALNQIGINGIDVDAAHVTEMWPHLEFIGYAAAEYGEPDRPSYRIHEAWLP